jgi:hypothetical protein
LCRCTGNSNRVRQRVDAVLELDPPSEQLPSLCSTLTYSPSQFQKLLEKVQAGEFRSRPTPSRNPGRGIREQHPGLWRQL